MAQSAPQRVLSLVEVVKGDDTNKLRWPVAVAAALEGRLAIADAFGPRLFLFKRIGVSLSLQNTIDLPAVPLGIAWNSGRWILTLRDAEGLLAIDDATSSQERIPLDSSVVPGALASGTGSGLLVFDLALSRVLLVSVDGKVTSTVPVGEMVTGLAAATGGGFYATVGHTGHVLHFDAAGKLTDRWEMPAEGPVPAWPTGIAATPKGKIFVADRHNGRILVLDQGGNLIGLGSRRGWDPGLLNKPAGLAWIPAGGLLVADLGNGRAQTFRLTSNLPGR